MNLIQPKKSIYGQISLAVSLGKYLFLNGNGITGRKQCKINRNAFVSDSVILRDGACLVTEVFYRIMAGCVQGPGRYMRA